MTYPTPRSSFPGRALVIGISDYVEAPALPLAVRQDAEDVAAVLADPTVGGYPPDQIELLLDGEATAGAIRAGLARLERECRLGDTVVIYFSGHGVRRPTPSLLAADINPANDRQALITRDELSASLGRIVSDRVVVILDSCHSGGAAVLKGDTPDGLSDSDLARLFTGRGRVIMSSSAEHQPSAILPDARNSLFTEQLLDALAGGAFGSGETIGVLELYSTAASATKRFRPEQTPGLKAEIEDDFAIARRPALRPSASPVASQMKLWELLADLYPLGPVDKQVWARAGGDLSRLNLGDTGRTNWFTAMQLLDLGGGGAQISRPLLVGTALRDYPRHPDLKAFS